MKWIKIESEKDCPKRPGRFFCKIKDENHDIFFKDVRVFGWSWVNMNDKEKIIEWLDESTPSMQQQVLEFCYHKYCGLVAYDYTQDFGGIKETVEHWLNNKADVDNFFNLLNERLYGK